METINIIQIIFDVFLFLWIIGHGMQHQEINRGVKKFVEGMLNAFKRDKEGNKERWVY